MICINFLIFSAAFFSLAKVTSIEVKINNKNIYELLKLKYY